jgi:hypothetical protein
VSGRILTLVIAEAAVLLAVVLILQTRRVSRVWLRWFPRALRESIGSYFDPPPSVHPHLPDPGDVEVDDDASTQDKRAASVARAVLSFGHGLQDAEHYVLRFAIAFFVTAIVTLAAVAVVVGIMSL